MQFAVAWTASFWHSRLALRLFLGLSEVNPGAEVFSDVSVSEVAKMRVIKRILNIIFHSDILRT